jgi:hypothetical protein
MYRKPVTAGKADPAAPGGGRPRSG